MKPLGRRPADIVPAPPHKLPRGSASWSPRDAALAYGAAGWPVLPVAGMSAGECACRRSCESPGKHPITRHGVHDATTDPVLIGEWWRRSPSANVGVATGAASGLVVVDIDLPKGGRQSLQALLAAGRRLLPTLTSRTGGGGLHLFYAQPPGAAVPNAVGRLPGLTEELPGIDVRGDGGYVVAPPSIHASGRRYRWDRRGIADLPSWILPRRIAPARATAAFPSTGGASAYGARALSRELEVLRGLVVGQRNDGLNRAAFCLGRLVGGGELSETLVVQTLLCAALAVGLSESEAAATIRSGLRAGMAIPRQAPEEPAWRPSWKPSQR
jgi:hypothetical protein